MIRGPLTALAHPRLYALALRLAWRLRASRLDAVVAWVREDEAFRGMRACEADSAATVAVVYRMLTPASLPGGRRCLVRALLVYGLLRRVMPESRVWVGFRPGESGPPIDGHAWVANGQAPLAAADADAPRMFPTVFELCGPTP